MFDWQTWVKRYWYLGVIGLLLVGIASGLFFMLRPAIPKTNNAAVFTSSSATTAATSTSTTPPASNTAGFVDVKGAVKKPGIYQVSANTRLFDVVRLAGGLATDADQQQINLAQQVSDQQVVFIPKVGEEVPPEYAAPATATPAVASETASTEGTGASGALVNLNTATAEELQQLTGIGQKKAELIIQFRTEQGGFQQPEDLKKVSGIGDKTFDSLKDSITV
ncbi:helix-hairpin-helix domain-containing protein [Loigolactobacillus binensis]|uniref:Helix-hairpin-helix domain-containing protein n=1 Tax=Loigolactobacillus binensis TaxID=2559922 RepID=A0ABW3E9P3_9LACO|nr:helix-hairpin-helix domain-containing protein [Loigolactobacillus binensis]